MIDIRGAKGGEDKAEQRVPVEAPNTLRSVSKGRILDLIAHGPIVGLANGLRSVILDGTPMQNPDGSMNFAGAVVATREGYPDQDVVPGFRAVENPIEVSAQVKFDTPIVRSVSNTDADAVVVTIQLAALTKQVVKTGDLKGHTVSVAIDAKRAGGEWAPRVIDHISGKTTSPYQRSYRINFDTEGPWDIRVRRLSADDAQSNTQSAFSWLTMTEVVDARLSYPDSALVGIELDARLFGNKMPSRAYDMKLSIIKVPSNYNPETREYAGIWDGTFKMAWTDNPAWAYYDLATHPVIGAGLENVDKWGLYQIARYCDELVPDGYGGMEPRFTLNTLLNDRQEAITVLSTLASVFRGMTYWGTNTVVAVADMPADPKKLVAPANVVNGEFEYSGTSLKERHSVAIVMWNDPEDSFKAKPEIVEDPDSVDLFGWRETQVTAVACSSRGQAHRLGKWILYSERMETETVSYSAAIDHADLRPGDLIQLSDPDRAGARLSGRVVETGTTFVTLDKVPAEASGLAWYLSVMMPAGNIERREIRMFAGNQVELVQPLSTTPIPGALWILSSAAVEPPLYRVVSVTENADATYKVTATEHDPNKYARVELDLQLAEPSNSLLPRGPVAPPMDITVEAYKYLAGGTEHQGLLVSWTPSSDPRVETYVLDVQGPTDPTFRTVYTGAGISTDILDASGGEWMLRLRSVTALGIGSAWVSRVVNIAGLLLPTPPDSIDVSVSTFSVALRPRSIYPGAMYEFWRSAAPLTDDLIEDNAQRLSVSTDLVDAGLRANTTYYYYVRGANAYGLSAWVPAQATTTAEFDDILSALDTDIRKPGGLFEQMVSEAGQVGVEAVGEELSLARAEASQALAEAGQAVTEATDAREAAEALVGRMGAVEAGVTALEWSSELEAIRHAAVLALNSGSTAMVAVEEATRAEQDLALSSRITTVEASVGENAALVEERLTALATADSALATRIDTLQASVGDDIAARVTTEETARATADRALATRIDTLEAEIGEDISARITTEEVARAAADGALASRITTLEASVGEDINARITAEQEARATSEAALASRIDTVTASAASAQTTADGRGKILFQSAAPSAADRLPQNLWIDTTGGANTPKRWNGTAWVAVTDKVATDAAAAATANAAAITSEQTARANGDSALSTRIDTLTSNTGNQFASVQQQFTAQTSYTDGAVARAVTTATVNGKKAVFGISVDGNVSEIGAVADRFYVYNPSGGTYTLAFAVVDGQTVIQDAMIRAASITSAKIADAAITSAKIGSEITSSNFVAGQTGWRLTKAGSFEMNGEVAGQGRTVRDSNGTRVYDSNGVLRVEMGLLS